MVRAAKAMVIAIALVFVFDIILTLAELLYKIKRDMN
jgi:hypothetical protein